ncbi:MAG: hypothetical protein RL204_867, partial [Bacteroidota bacterium]
LSLLAFVFNFQSFSQCIATGDFYFLYPESDNFEVDFFSTDSVENCLGSGQYFTYSWDFSGLATSELQHPDYMFPGFGTYTVCLTVSTHDQITDEILGQATTCMEVVFSDCSLLEGTIELVEFIDNQCHLVYTPVGFVNDLNYYWYSENISIPENDNGGSEVIYAPGNTSNFTGNLSVYNGYNCYVTIPFTFSNPTFNPCLPYVAIIDNGYSFQCIDYNPFPNTITSWYIDGVFQASGGIFTFTPNADGVYTITCETTNSDYGCTDQVTQEIEYLSPVTMCGIVFLDSNQNGIQDIGEPGLPQIGIGNFTESQTDENGYYELPIFPGQLNWININDNNSGFECLSGGIFNAYGNALIDPTSILSGCVYNIAMIEAMGTVCGTVYLDSNESYALESSDPVFSNALLEYTIEGTNGVQNLSALTNLNGEFCLTIPSGYQTVELSFITQNGTSYVDNVDFSVQTNLTVTRNIRLDYLENSLDLEIGLAGISNPVSGLNTHFNVFVNNNGDVPGVFNVEVSVPEFFIPNGISFLGGVQGIFDDASNTISWTNVDIPPLGHHFTQVNGQIMIGTPLNTEAVLVGQCVALGDVDATNNSDIIHWHIVSSYDPNNKLSYPSGVGETGDMLPSNDPFTYVINFQNTGTSEAINIRIEDQLDEDLDWTSIEMLGATHDYLMQMVNGHITWQFNNIMLPDSNTNEELSHGQIVYRIHPIADMPVGTVFENTAYIYFDFNEAIITNTAVNTFVSSIGVNEVETSAGISIYPNPSEGDFTISAEDMNAGDYIVIFDAMGREVFRKQVMNSNTTQIDTDLSTGQYVLQIQGSVNVQTTKVVVR